MSRNAGLFGGRTHATCIAPYADLADAIDPRTFGLHPAHLYARPDFPFSPFDAARPITWAAALDATERRRVWIPRCFAYYAPTDEPALAFETSNGCATGSSLAEAALHGIFELAERDAFLWHWYARASPPRIDDLLKEPGIAVLAARIRFFTGADLHLVDTTRDYGIPSVAAIATRDGSDGPATSLAAGAGADLASATGAALQELGGHLIRLISVFDDSGSSDAARRAFDDPDAVLTMDHHGTVNALPEARPRFAALLAGPASSGLARPSLSDAGDSPEALLATLIRRLAGHGLRVIVVDQTTTALRRFGLHAAKVVVPGWIPMTFGHIFRRTAIASLAGIPDADLVPHPFP